MNDLSVDEALGEIAVDLAACLHCCLSCPDGPSSHLIFPNSVKMA